MKSKPFLFLFILLVAISPWAVGCSSRSKSGASGNSTAVDRYKKNNANFVKSALEYTLSIQRFEEKGFKSTMVKDLNDWAKTLEPNIDWQPDPLLDTIDEKYKETAAVQSISENRFQASDSEFLQEAIWLKAIVDRVTADSTEGIFRYFVGAACHGQSKEEIEKLRGSTSPLYDALRSLYSDLSNEQVEELTKVCQVFDWTIRNIQLDEMPVEYTGDAERQKATDYVDVPTGDAVFDGVEGPGYDKTIGQILLKGKADAWQRARLFVNLCRQLGVDAVLLNVADRNDANKQVPWTVGVIIAERIFLFDAEMGLPFPSRDYRRIATLDEVLKDRSTLTQLRYKLSESTDAIPDYRIQPQQLDKLTVWLDASPEFLSQRMEALEPKLTGDYKAKITYRPSTTAKFLETKNLQNVQLSPIPIQNAIYQSVFNNAIERRKTNALIKNYMENEYFKIKIPIKKVSRQDRIDSESQSIQAGGQVKTASVTTYLLLEARHRFLLGVFEADMANNKSSFGARKLREDFDLGRETEDAAQMFVTLSLDDRQIEELMSDDDWLYMLGISADQNTTMSAQELASYKSILLSSMKLIRTDSSLWLALTNFETGDYGNAKNWLEQIPRFDLNNKWAGSTNYNLARIYEAQWDFKKAIELYRAGKSQQRFGNIMRARLVQRWNLGDESATQPE